MARRLSEGRPMAVRHDERVTATVAATQAPARTADLFVPGRRGLTLGLVSTITLVALESLAIGTVMPIVTDELGDRALYGWVYTAFFLGSLLGIVLAGGALDRMPLHRPFAGGPRPVRRRPRDRRVRAVDADPRARPVHPGARRRGGGPDGLRRDRALPAPEPAAEDVRDALDRVGGPGHHRAVDRRGRRRVRELALGVPGPRAAARDRGVVRLRLPAPGRGACPARGARGRRVHVPSSARRAPRGGRRRHPRRGARPPRTSRSSSAGR